MQIDRTLSRYNVVPLTYLLDPVAASLTDQQMPMVPVDTLASYAPDGWTMPFAGYLLAISGRLSAAASAGTLTIGPTINGTEQAALTQTVTTGVAPYGVVPRESVRFAAGDSIGAEVTTSAAWNGTGSGLAVIVWAIIVVDGV
jgi:hypothetical protein